MDVFERLKEIREYKKLTWKEWAERSGLTEVGLRKMFENKSLTTVNLIAICQAAGINPAEIFTGDDIHLANEPAASYELPENKLLRAEKLIREVRQKLQDNGNHSTPVHTLP